MPRPRIFISSTYYDLKHIRASLDLFIDSLGYDSVLSEKGDIAYTHDKPLDESCYREVENSDIFVLIIGGRYGSEASNTSRTQGKSQDRYESITKKEFESAIIKDIPAYILIEKGVHLEYRTFLRNKDRQDVSYAHVDSANIFRFIDEILSLPRNNPVQSFEKFDEVESWLREQWAGLFREMLRKQSQQQQMTGLSAQIAELKETNETLRRYLEAVMTGATPKETSELIESEERRLEAVRMTERFRLNQWVNYIMAVRPSSVFLDIADIFKATQSSATIKEYFDQICGSDLGWAMTLYDLLANNSAARHDFNLSREIAGVSPFQFGAYILNADDKQEIKQNTGDESIPLSAALQHSAEVTPTAGIQNNESPDIIQQQEKSSIKASRRRSTTSKTNG